MEREKPDLTQREKLLLKKIQGKINYCLYDQSYEGSDVIWILGDESDMYEVLWDNNVPEKSWNKILSHLKCPSCGFNDFELGFRVGLKSNYDVKLEKLYDLAHKKYQEPLKEFESLMINTPTLALKNPLAKKIHKSIYDTSLKISRISGEFYRARKADPEKIYTSEDLKMAPLGIPDEGRYNRNGKPHLYLSENEKTAEAEVLQGKNTAIDIYIQKFEIKTPYTKILDLSHELYEIDINTPALLVALFHFIEKKGNNVLNYRPDYFISNYIADCAKDAGYDGIKYVSALNHNGYNVVLFKDFDKVVPVGDPILKKTKPFTESQQSFDDLLDI